ncbi:MAG: hypothetical protein KJ804_11380 [Proteobacteria bacterium]|nr:hypothetical protein [Pseudomonadota bacterium]MBU1058908.1 hypothetical protein [Pseudomonadota bacterium]
MKINIPYSHDSKRILVSEFFWSFIIPPDFQAMRHSVDVIKLSNEKDVDLGIRCFSSPHPDLANWIKKDFEFGGNLHFKGSVSVRKDFFNIAYFKADNGFLGYKLTFTPDYYGFTGQLGAYPMARTRAEEFLITFISSVQYHGRRRDISRNIQCDRCSGSGMVMCSFCGGNGYTSGLYGRNSCSCGNGYQTCPECSGSGMQFR